MDHVYVGIPVPAAMVLFGLPGLLGVRRR